MRTTISILFTFLFLNAAYANRSNPVKPQGGPDKSKVVVTVDIIGV